MKGYTTDEVNVIRGQVNEVVNALDILQRTMQAYDFRETPSRQLTPNHAPQTTMIMDELETQGGVALSEAEQQVAQRINLDD